MEAPETRAAVLRFAPRRVEIKTFVTIHPGSTLRATARGVGMPVSMASYHVHALARHSDIVVVHHGGGMMLFPSGSAVTNLNAAKALANPDTKKLWEWLQTQHLPRQRDIIAHATQAWGWSRYKTRRRLVMLEVAGLHA